MSISSGLTFFFGIFFLVSLSGASECERTLSLEKTEFLSDGGSIRLHLSRSCGAPLFVEQKANIYNYETQLYIDGDLIYPGSEKELKLIFELDRLIAREAKGKSLKKFEDIQMKSFVVNSERNFAAVIGVIRLTCAKDSTKKRNKLLCKKYNMNNL